MKRKVNVLYTPLMNEYNNRFGTIRIEFPTAKVDFRKLELPDSNLKDDPSSRLMFEKNAPDDWGRDTDVWNQELTQGANSLEEALNIYFEDY